MTLMLSVDQLSLMQVIVLPVNCMEKSETSSWTTNCTITCVPYTIEQYFLQPYRKAVSLIFYEPKSAAPTGPAVNSPCKQINVLFLFETLLSGGIEPGQKECRKWLCSWCLNVTCVILLLLFLFLRLKVSYQINFALL